ncbi:ATP-grasp domain-containing protein [Streptomyces sp. NPDC057798]|uniref:ATP-grasp domain-containing protein n=1 Tax=Streptomyces sp. NPDC057798 TaxID=3346252 RepID=UPI0036BAB6B0
MAPRIALLGGRPNVLKSASDLGCEVVLMHTPGAYDPAAAAQWCSEVVETRLSDEDGSVAAGRELFARQPVVRFFSPSELGLVAAARLNEEFGLGGNSVRTVRLLKDKSAMRRHLAEVGMSPVRFRVVHGEAELVAFLTELAGPAVIKPLDYGGSALVYRLDGPAEAGEIWRQVEAAGRTRMLVEEFLVGLEVSVEAFSDNGVHTVVAVTDKLLGAGFVEAGHSVPARIDERTRREIAELTAQLLDAVGLVEGPSHTEIMITDKGPRIIESHNRAGGDSIPELVRRAYGVDLVRSAVAVPLGLEAWTPEVPAATAGAAIRFVSAEPGVVTGVEVPDPVPEGVVLDVKARPGTVVPPVTWSVDRVCGHVIAVGADAAEAVDRCEKALAGIKITTRARTVVMVDAFASARCLAPLFRAQGYDCVHVQSTPEIPAAYERSFQPGDFIANIIHEGDIDRTVAAIAAHRPTALLPGIERAVVLADTLSEQLGLLTNGTALSTARRDKYRMIETVKEAGVPGPDQILAGDPDTLLRWYEKVQGRVVLKPVSSAGSDGVYFCDDADEVRKAFNVLIGSTSALGQDNHAVLAQEYLVGSEYIVNTVSLEGRHYVTDIWKMHHLTANGVPDVAAGAELMLRRGVEQDQLVEHTVQVLDALGVRNGPAHTELKLTADGPRLVETGARVCGADVHVPVKAAIGESQLDWTVDAYVNPDRFLERWESGYELARHARVVNMVSPAEGRLVSYPRMSELQALDSFHDILVRVHPGGEIFRSIDDWTFPLRVYLLHEVASTVARDALTTRYLDGEGFYEIA